MNEPYEGVTWWDARALSVRGLGWTGEDREASYDRLPATMKPRVSERLWQLATWTSGVYVTFRGAPTQLFARWTLDPDRSLDAKMSLLAREGLDTYGRDAGGHWRWVGSRETWKEPTCDGLLHQNLLDGEDREYCVYFPLMRRLLRLEIGAREPLAPVASEPQPPIAYYGTSIVHGAAVSRPGMSHAAQLGRRLDHEILNLGFCGRAWCENCVAEALGRLDPTLYIVDVLPNNSAEEAAQRLPPFLRTLRAARPRTPILLLGDRLFGDHAFVAGRHADCQEKNAALEGVVVTLHREGLNGLHTFLSPAWFGDDGEATVDASHPTDLGAYRMACVLEPVVRAMARA
jgi:hypothetical protein